MNLDRILEELEHKGVKLWAEGDNLRVRAPKEILTLELQNLLRNHKIDLLTYLRQNNNNVRQKGLDLYTEATLDSAIFPVNPTSSFVTEPAAIFLTGATGFMGAFLLQELLQQTTANIYCLVRATDVDAAKIRIQKSLESYQLVTEQFYTRIIPVLGDLSEPLLGLPRQQFEELANHIDRIYHSAAFLNYVYSYHKLKPVNVLGTQEVLRLACQGKIKPVHYISTFVIFASPGYYQQVVKEADPLTHGHQLEVGYFQSKWVAEKLVTIARSRGLPVNIYRLPFVSGHSQTGVWNTDDLVCRTIKGYIQMGSMPDLDHAIDLSPVDYGIRSIVYLSGKESAQNGVFHLNNQQPLSCQQLFNYIDALGYSIQQVAYPQWLEQLRDKEKSRSNVLFPLLPFFNKRWAGQQLTIQELYQKKLNPDFDCQLTLEALDQSEIVCPPVDEKLLNTYFSYFIRSGFIEAPSDNSKRKKEC